MFVPDLLVEVVFDGDMEKNTRTDRWRDNQPSKLIGVTSRDLEKERLAGAIGDQG